jgi:eukaryotic-like serine/threonine-protein kinase
METVRQVIDDDPVPPSRLVPRVPRDLETICLKCLHKEPHKRYDSAQELGDELDRFREGKPIKARPTPFWERGRKWSKRRPVAALSLALGLLMVLGLTASYIVFKDQHNNQVFRDKDRGLELLYQADQAKDREHLADAKFALAAFLADVKDEPELQTISVRVDEKRKWVVDQLQVLSLGAAAREHDREDRGRFQKFLDLRPEAQLYAAGLEVLDPADRLKKLRASAHAALAIFATDSLTAIESWTLADPLPTALSEVETTRVRDGCYDLLLILSQATDDPADGLRILDRAARLRRETTAAYHLRRADCLERAGDLAGRDRESRVASQIKPVTALDYFLNGRELAFRGQFADAIHPLETAVQRDLDQTSAHLLLAVCYLNMRPKLLSAARTHLNTCIRSHPDLIGLYLMRASIFAEEGSQAHEKEAEDAFEAAETDFRHALHLNPNDDFRYVLLTNRGLLRLRSDRLDEAVADLDAAIRLKPNQYQAHTTLAQVHQRKGRLDDARVAFTRAIACHPDPSAMAGLYRSRALLYAPRKGISPAEYATALRDFEDAIRLEPDKVLKASDNVWRARLFFGVGQQSQEALAACDAALKLVPDDPEAHQVRISALMDLKRYDEVLASANAYLARGKPSAEVVEIRGLAHVSRRHFTAAIADYNRALELMPDAGPAERSRVFNLRGWAYHFADAPRLALSDFEESLRLKSNQSDAFGGRGLARIRLGQWRPAVTDAETAVRLARAVVPTTGDDRQAQVQALFNAARIYALAVAFAAQDVSRHGERSVILYRRYRSRALDLLEESLKQVPDRERRDEILNDPALRSLRRGTSGNPATRLRAWRGSPDTRRFAAHGPREGLPAAWTATLSRQTQ